MSSNFGKNLNRIRLDRGLTQTELGKLVGLSKRMVVHYEKHVRRPPAEKVAALAQALKVKTDELLANPQQDKTTTVDPMFARKLEKAKKLPSNDQEFLSTMIDSLLKKNDLHTKKPRKNTKPKDK